MDSLTNFSVPYITDDEMNQFRSCIMLRKTLLLLGTRKRPTGPKRKHDVTKSCLHWLREWGNLNLDDSSMIDLLYEVITQYIFVKMPSGYLFRESCLFHHYYCHCIVKRRENFVLNELHQLGVDVNQFRPQIDAAFIMTMENNSGNVPGDGRPIDQPSRRNVPPLTRRKKMDAHGISQLAMRIACSRYHFVPLPEDSFKKSAGTSRLPHYR